MVHSGEKRCLYQVVPLLHSQVDLPEVFAALASLFPCPWTETGKDGIEGSPLPCPWEWRHRVLPDSFINDAVQYPDI